jgi:hypothetical protein
LPLFIITLKIIRKKEERKVGRKEKQFVEIQYFNKLLTL